jgi:hypothetical protein
MVITHNGHNNRRLRIHETGAGTPSEGNTDEGHEDGSLGAPPLLSILFLLMFSAW